MEEKKFTKYTQKGAYHWQMIKPSIRTHNAFLSGRYEMIRRLAEPLKGKRVLDLGCGDGVLSHYMRSAGADLVGMDIEIEALIIAKQEFQRHAQNAVFIGGSAYALPFPACSFDTVVSSDVIEHVQQPERMLKEIWRVLKSGGKTVISTPIRYTEHPLDSFHVHEYYPDEFSGLLKQFFIEVSIYQSHPLSEKVLYERRSKWLLNKRIHRLFTNFSTLYLHQNPFMLTDKTVNSLMSGCGVKR